MGGYHPFFPLMYGDEDDEYVDQDIPLVMDEYLMLHEDMSFERVKDVIALWRLDKNGETINEVDFSAKSVSMPDSAELVYTRSIIKGFITKGMKIVYSPESKSEDGIHSFEIKDCKAKTIKYDWIHPSDIDGAKILGVESRMRDKVNTFNQKETIEKENEWFIREGGHFASASDSIK